MRMTAIRTQTERKRQDRSVHRAEKRRRRAGMLRVYGPIRPTAGVCATTDAARGEKRLISWRNQAILTSAGRPLGECRLIENRVSISRKLLNTSGIMCQAIDDVEFPKLKLLDETLFSYDLGVVAVRSNPAGRSTPTGVSISHEYAVFLSQSETASVGRIPRSEKQSARYSEKDSLGFFEWVNFRKHGGIEAQRSARPKMFFPFYAKEGSVRVPSIEWNETENGYNILEEAEVDEHVIWPISEEGKELRWKWGVESVKRDLDNFKFDYDRSKRPAIYLKSRMVEDGMLPVTWWEDKKYSATEYGTNLLKRMFGGVGSFSFPKSIHLVTDCLRVANASPGEITLDFFAGSGTTAHAVIDLNRHDHGNRKYILVEQGDYFHDITKPRVQKIIYSTIWKDGKPTAPETGISHAFKVLKIEGYEDALNNLDLERPQGVDDLFQNLGDEARDDYLMRYMLDVEAKGSLLSVSDFRKPFDYTLKVAVDSAGAWEERKVDLVETFNYLIGLTVRSIDIQLDRGFVTVEGWLPTGEKTLILWRDCEKIGYEELTRLCDKLAINPADSEFEVVYINGDHNIPSVVETTEDEGSVIKKLMLRQIEPAFLDAMFNVDDV
jgi:adenine-specific DNA-methyltransferase